MHYFLLLLSIFTSCSSLNQSNITEQVDLDPDFNDYWYNGEAEISNYKLSQARYGELRDGNAVLIFVTEHHSPSKGTKPDKYVKDQVPVLKLNSTRNFHTGIYPYSIMNSSFFPVKGGNHSLKVTSSSQEWCGHTYMELQNSKSQFHVKVSSYFDGESGETRLNKTLLEDDLMSLIRIRPESLPIGKKMVIPSLVAIRLSHLQTKSYSCELSLIKGDKINTYTAYYPEIDRRLSINFENTFPYKIIEWREEFVSGYGSKRQKLTSTATLINTLKSDYWTKNSNSDHKLRKELGFKN